MKCNCETEREEAAGGGWFIPRCAVEVVQWGPARVVDHFQRVRVFKSYMTRHADARLKSIDRINRAGDGNKFAGVAQSGRNAQMKSVKLAAELIFQSGNSLARVLGILSHTSNSSTFLLANFVNLSHITT